MHPLERWLKERKARGEQVRKRELARQVGCSPSRISQILHHGSEPSLSLAVRLSEATALPVDCFVKREAVE